MLLLSMYPRFFQSRLSVCLGLCAVMAAVAHADADLAISSPFLSATAAPVAAVATNTPIEYRGYMVTPEGERFSIYNPAKKTATWVGLNEQGSPFVVRTHRLVGSGTDQITVDYQGSSVVLALKEAKIGSVPVPTAPVFNPPPNPGTMNIVNAPAVQGNPPALPAGASIEEWATEVQRRRDLRQQSAGQPAAPASRPPIQGTAPATGAR